MASTKLDCKGLSCPMPIVKIAKAFKELTLGDTLEVESTDGAFKPDVEAWAKKTGNVLTLCERAGGVTRAILIKKAA